MTEIYRIYRIEGWIKILEYNEKVCQNIIKLWH